MEFVAIDIFVPSHFVVVVVVNLKVITCWQGYFLQVVIVIYVMLILQVFVRCNTIFQVCVSS